VAGLRVLLLDDTKRGIDVTSAAIAGRGVNITKIEPDQLRDHLMQFFDAADADLKQAKRSLGAFADWDDHDLIIVDNNLSEKVPGYSAEGIIARMRVHLSIPYYIILNKDPYLDFNLTALVSDRTTTADLALRGGDDPNSASIGNPALWSEAKRSNAAFAPSYWSLIHEAIACRRAQIARVRRLDSELFGIISPSFANHVGDLSDRAFGALAPDRGTGDTKKLTIKDFFLHACRSIPKEIKEKLLENKRVDCIARVVAAELEAILRRDVLAPQDTVVSLAHLISRMPFLLDGNIKSLKSWNAALSASAPHGLKKSLFDKHIKKHETGMANWLGQPTFWWRPINEDPGLLKESIQSRDIPDFVFCEDIYRFVDRAKDNPKEFNSDVDGGWRQRFVSKDGDGYLPKSRFAQ
jgi:hypothetical protein